MYILLTEASSYSVYYLFTYLGFSIEILIPFDPLLM